MWRRLIYHPEINYALRQTLVLCLPVLFGLLIGQLQLGLMFSLVPACCNIAGLDTPHKRTDRRRFAVRLQQRAAATGPCCGTCRCRR